MVEASRPNAGRIKKGVIYVTTQIAVKILNSLSLNLWSLTAKIASAMIIGGTSIRFGMGLDGRPRFFVGLVISFS